MLPGPHLPVHGVGVTLWLLGRQQKRNGECVPISQVRRQACGPNDRARTPAAHRPSHRACGENVHGDHASAPSRCVACPSQRGARLGASSRGRGWWELLESEAHDDAPLEVTHRRANIYMLPARLSPRHFGAHGPAGPERQCRSRAAAAFNGTCDEPPGESSKPHALSARKAVWE